VRVISRKLLVEFWRKHAEAKATLSAWFKVAEKGSFGNLSELKRTFATVDYVPVGDRGFYVFNIGGKKYRLVAAIHFNRQILFVRRVMTHAEYNRGDWKK
jgi:mRNA interferase HigB